METPIVLVVEFIEFQSSVNFESCIDKDLIEFWWAYLVVDSPHATDFFIISTFQYWSLLVIQDSIGRIPGLWWIHMIWRVSLILTHNLVEKCLDFVKFKIVIVQFLLDIITILLEFVSGFLLVSKTISWKVAGYPNCSPSCLFCLKYRILSYE